ncbi:MAG: hypothetical protein N4A49_09695 [Marinifilaceae bacterium]|jgi:hypothetical protein|nr:hypothetical protein [Marinifilaceae bacterium]
MESQKQLEQQQLQKQLNQKKQQQFEKKPPQQFKEKKLQQLSRSQIYGKEQNNKDLETYIKSNLIELKKLIISQQNEIGKSEKILNSLNSQINAPFVNFHLNENADRLKIQKRNFEFLKLYGFKIKEELNILEKNQYSQSRNHLMVEKSLSTMNLDNLPVVPHLRSGKGGNLIPDIYSAPNLNQARINLDKDTIQFYYISLLNIYSKYKHMFSIEKGKISKKHKYFSMSESKGLIERVFSLLENSLSKIRLIFRYGLEDLNRSKTLFTSNIKDLIEYIDANLNSVYRLKYNELNSKLANTGYYENEISILKHLKEVINYIRLYYGNVYKIANNIYAELNYIKNRIFNLYKKVKVEKFQQEEIHLKELNKIEDCYASLYIKLEEYKYQNIKGGNFENSLNSISFNISELKKYFPSKVYSSSISIYDSPQQVSSLTVTGRPLFPLIEKTNVSSDSLPDSEKGLGKNLNHKILANKLPNIKKAGKEQQLNTDLPKELFPATKKVTSNQYSHDSNVNDKNKSNINDLEKNISVNIDEIEKINTKIDRLHLENSEGKIEGSNLEGKKSLSNMDLFSEINDLENKKNILLNNIASDEIKIEGLKKA